jgi:uncharacterized membrane protein
MQSLTHEVRDMKQPAAIDGLEPNFAPGAATAEIRSIVRQAGALRSRIDSVDLLRGLVMVFMLIDHTRDFVHGEAFFFDPVDMTRTYPALFFTRWITHFCAPIFVFLAGTSIYLRLARRKSKPEMSRFLLTRGLWLIVLEFTLIRFLVFWNFDYGQLIGFAQVIWVFGWSMILLAGLIYLPVRAVAAFGIVMIVGHNLLDSLRVPPWQGPGTPIPGFGASLWMILHQQGLLLPFGYPGPVWFILYPLIPWLGVMAVGYAMGTVYDNEKSPKQRRNWLLRWGTAITVGFIILRATNLYGDPGQWSVQKSAAMTVVSFLNVQKYPPSLLFLMMTLGPALIALALWEKHNEQPDTGIRIASPGTLARMLITYGRVPLFFYILQWIYAHSAGYLLSLIAGKPTFIYFRLPGPGPTTPPNVGFDLWVVFAVWFVGVLLIYPLCKWYARVKERRTDWWLSYL